MSGALVRRRLFVNRDIRQTALSRLCWATVPSPRHLGPREHPPPIRLTQYNDALYSSFSPTSIDLVCYLRSSRLASPRNFRWRGAAFSTPITQGPIICHDQTRGDLGAGSLNSKRSAEYAPLGLSRTRASGKEYPDYRGADSLTAEVGHQGEDSAKSGESVRTWIRIKSGVSSQLSSLPHPPLLSSPPISSSLPLPLFHSSTYLYLLHSHSHPFYLASF